MDALLKCVVTDRHEAPNPPGAIECLQDIEDHMPFGMRRRL